MEEMAPIFRMDGSGDEGSDVCKIGQDQLELWPITPLPSFMQILPVGEPMRSIIKLCIHHDKYFL